MIKTASLPADDEMYRALCERDASYEGVFVAAIRTTGIFCRPTCPARKPNRENVEFFSNVNEALFAGFRPCLRCRPMEPRGAAPRWLRGLLDAVDEEPSRRWTDADIQEMGLTPSRVRRWFQTQHGMTFHAYQRARRLGLALGRIRNGGNLDRSAYEHGYESVSGFREAFAQMFDEPPGRSRDADPIVLTRLLTPLGPMLAGAREEGICLLEFADRSMLETQFERLRQRFACGIVPGSSPHIDRLEEELREYFQGARTEFEVPLLYPGTDFQVACWEYLRTIPYGATRSYGEQASALGRPGAQRAVGRANGDNRLAIVIPCHRVVGADGRLTGYGGGLWRKKILLEHEEARSVGGGQLRRESVKWKVESGK